MGFSETVIGGLKMGVARREDKHKQLELGPTLSVVQSSNPFIVPISRNSFLTSDIELPMFGNVEKEIVLAYVYTGRGDKDKYVEFGIRLKDKSVK
ncbi:hypothetical protein RHGRI_021336 [Rhododendron griersonianum]|uniref:Uncharacterized protein n=1 Tax=Rhododendron griersonianum TaxID=479676 RepID=A0AAV6JLR7_9ERIC|nr:hypothetical protein RHGRI_021336 [Rhododendron griersonianum]